MIVSFAHKGLERFFKTGSVAGIQAKHAAKLKLILALLHRAEALRDVDFPGSGLHPLKGERKGFWSVKVNGNWRIIFRMEGQEVSVVDYLDYH